MVKWPDIWKPTFEGQFMFDCIIKSTHLGDVPKAKSWDLGAHTVPWGLISVLGLKSAVSVPLHNTSWSLNGRSDKKFIRRPSFGHKEQ